MLSNKMTFSLMSLVMLLAFGLVYVVPSVMAHDVADETALTAAEIAASNVFHVKLSVDESVQDVSSDSGVHIASGRTRADREIPELAGTDVAAGAGRIIVLATFAEEVHLQIVDDATLTELSEIGDEGALTLAEALDFLSSAGAFGADDIVVDAFDNEGRNLGSRSLAEVLIRRAIGEAGIDAAVIIKHKNPGGRIAGEQPSKEFLIQIDQSELENVYAPQGRGGGVDPDVGLEIHTLFFSIAPGVVQEASRDAIIRQRTGKHLHSNTYSSIIGTDDPTPLRVDMVDDDEGDPNYDQIRGISLVAIEDSETQSDDGVPGVVYITAPNIVVRGAYYAHILLTEQPHENTFTVMVDGGQGTAGDPEWLKAVAPEELTGESVGVGQDAASLRPGIPGGYSEGNGWSTATEGDSGTYDTGEYTVAVPATYDAATRVIVGGSIPQATGRDNMYHLYRVQVTPVGGATGNITVSVGQFNDKVLPLPNTYLPLSVQQRRATTFVGDVEQARVTRIMNSREALTVPLLGVADDTTSIKAIATAAYKTRQEGVFDVAGNLTVLGVRLVIPAGGYLVLATGGDEAASGIKSVDAKIKQKKTAASKLYNVAYGVALQFPANDLSNFFRNGGSLSLAYADIPAATAAATGDKSQIHDDAKPITVKDDPLDDTKIVVDTGHDDYTGYDGASTNAYAAGALQISEIMWGFDAGKPAAQYIELHNPGTTALGIDSKEWVIAVGEVPTGFTAIDTVNNNPATGYWEVPGSDGVSTIEPAAGFFSLVDIVSMSRIGTDGSAAASWAASMRPSANLGGRRIGSPGAANIYVKPAPPTDPTTEPTTPAAPAAEADDIMISEVMVGSNDGRLPQWIELANVSGAAVSLSGWSLVVDNDSADADVVGGSVEIDLGDVEIDADQVALVISKASARNSGVGDSDGDLRADRIIDVQSMVSPDNARYSLISEMGFMISLMPPQTGAVRMYGDVVGNLGEGWEIPASEGGRSSLIRREMNDTGEIMGTDAAGWVLASDTMLGGAYRTTYYGSDEDVGTPGYNAGGALPVELSGFGAKRDPLTGAVVITWSTQSELNNAGFFIKRSQQQDGTFVVVNPTMIAGAGTTAEKQSYTYTDATADPNVIYYYQIEDVSLDGNRQTLTRAHRLKGHIGAAGKATTTWGDLKSSRD